MDVLAYAHLAEWAYSQPPDIGKESGSARAVVGNTDDGLAIIFRGTDNLASILADIDAIPHPTASLGNVHKGFYEALLSVEQELIRAIKGHAKIVLVGHSEGGALALLFGAWLCLHNTPPVAIYAFESPKISADCGIKQLFAQYKLVPKIYKNGSDPVPDVPSLMANWQHPANVIHIGQPAGLLPIIDDHRIANVIASLR